MVIEECKDIDVLFKVWKEYNEENPIDNNINGRWTREKSAFIKDGVLRLPNDGHSKWTDSSYPKVLFIIKDQYQDANNENNRWDEDIRDWLVWSDEKNTHRGEDNLNLKPVDGRANIFRQLGRWLYGVNCIRTEGRFVPYEEITDNVIKNYIKNNPMAIMEAKKQPGGSKLDEKVLRKYLERDKDFIKKEIELLNPDIIICCDGPGTIYKNLLRLFDEKNNDSKHCIGKIREHTLVINTYHPSARGKKKSYYQVIQSLRYED